MGTGSRDCAPEALGSWPLRQQGPCAPLQLTLSAGEPPTSPFPRERGFMGGAWDQSFSSPSPCRMAEGRGSVLTDSHTGAHPWPAVLGWKAVLPFVSSPV